MSVLNGCQASLAAFQIETIENTAQHYITLLTFIKKYNEFCRMRAERIIDFCREHPGRVRTEQRLPTLVEAKRQFEEKRKEISDALRSAGETIGKLVPVGEVFGQSVEAITPVLPSPLLDEERHDEHERTREMEASSRFFPSNSGVDYPAIIVAIDDILSSIERQSDLLCAFDKFMTLSVAHVKNLCGDFKDSDQMDDQEIWKFISDMEIGSNNHYHLNDILSIVNG